MEIQTDGHPKLDRGTAVLCLPISSADRGTIDWLERLIGLSERSTIVMIAASASVMALIQRSRITERLGNEVRGVVVKDIVPADLIEALMRESAPADVALAFPGVRVADGWLGRLRSAALSDSTIASATPLCLGDAGIERFDAHGPVGRSFADAARLVASGSPLLRPKIARIGPGCFYIRRSALDLIDRLQENVAIERSLSDFALRLNALGMVHVLADDVLVEVPANHAQEAVGRRESEHCDDSDECEESFRETLTDDESGSLHRALRCAQMAVHRLSVTIDGRALTASFGGTQTYVIELILALARERSVSLRVLAPPDLSERAEAALGSAPDVELLTYDEAISETRRTDVAHRPQQAFTPDDLTLLRLVGERVVIGQQDLIAYHNHSYHADVEAWRGYRRTTRLALAGADQVIFFSEHARRDALGEDLLPVARTHVVGVGADSLESSSLLESRPAGLLSDESFLLCLGADYAHKNRPFAIELLGALLESGWMGRLVLAGPHVPYGSSRAREAELLAQRPELAKGVVDLGVVDGPTMRWLYRHARSLIYATLYEGFGLVPLEASRWGVPCAFAAQASLSEVAGSVATLIPWDARSSALAVRPFLDDGEARERHLAELAGLPVPKWRDVAQQLLKVYEQAVSDPCAEAAPRVWQELDREGYIARLGQDIGNLKEIAQRYQDSYHSLESRVSGGLALIDTGGLLSPDQQRGLMRIARRPAGAFALKPLGPLGRVGRGRSSSNEPTDQK